VTELAPVADGVDHPLDPRVVPLQKTVGWILAACMSAGLLVGLFVLWLANGPTMLRFTASATIWMFSALAFTWHLQRWPAIAYRHTSYRVDDRGIEIRRGVYWRSIVNVPRSRVQHTDVSQGPLERGYGLGTLVVHTAGTDHARVHLSGLDHAIALRIREHLLPGAASDAV
jgi:membrane protein YdbS with pleckstrin-like domain